MSKRCFIDLDGVLVDFVNGMCKAHNKPNPYLNVRNYGRYDMAKIWGMSKDEFWLPANNIHFWSELEFTKDGLEILAENEDEFGMENICILSTPSRSEASVLGKMIWIKWKLPAYRRRYLLTPMKYLCATPNAILIDDNLNNIKIWEEQGGEGQLVARPWNLLEDVQAATTIIPPPPKDWKKEKNFFEKVSDRRCCICDRILDETIEEVPILIDSHWFCSQSCLKIYNSLAEQKDLGYGEVDKKRNTYRDMGRVGDHCHNCNKDVNCLPALKTRTKVFCSECCVEDFNQFMSETKARIE